VLTVAVHSLLAHHQHLQVVVDVVVDVERTQHDVVAVCEGIVYEVLAFVLQC